jgi:PadR family transcriptional regulator PadR
VFLFDNDIGIRYRWRRTTIGMAAPRQRTDMLKGALRMLVLKTLALEPRHGVGIADRIKQITRGTFDVGPGSLFPVLHRLEQEGLIDGEWTVTPEGRRAKYYRMTQAGSRQLAAEKKKWAKVALAIGQILEAD